MCSQAKLEANRRNAQLSTGPRTEAGKAISSRNAITHGFCSTATLAPGEDPAAYEAFAGPWRQHFAAQAPPDQFLVDRLTETAWKLKRLPAIESAVFQQLYLRHAERAEQTQQTEEQANANPSLPEQPTIPQLLAEDLLQGDRNSAFLRLHRYEMSLNRTYNKVMNDLRLSRSGETRFDDALNAPAPNAGPDAVGASPDAIGKPKPAPQPAAAAVAPPRPPMATPAESAKQTQLPAPQPASAAPAAPQKAPVPQPQLTLPVLPSVFSQQKEPKKPLTKAQKAQAALANACLSTLQQTGWNPAVLSAAIR